MNRSTNPQTPTNEHLLLIRGTHWASGLSPADLQRVMTDFYAWWMASCKRASIAVRNPSWRKASWSAVREARA